jgi:hypothetical protein
MARAATTNNTWGFMFVSLAFARNKDEWQGYSSSERARSRAWLMGSNGGLLIRVEYPTKMREPCVPN